MTDDAKKAPDDPFGDEPDDQDEFGIDQRRMTFLEHLLELRSRLFIVIATLAVTAILFFVVLGHQLWDWLTYPVKTACAATASWEEPVRYKDLLKSFSPTSFFMTRVYYCVYAAIAVTIPVTLWQLWGFVAPGLKRKERRIIGPAVLVTMLLFLAGAAFAYFVIIPIMLTFFLEDANAYGIGTLWGIAETVNLEAIMMLIMGVTFELPMVIVLLSKIGIVSPRFLAKYRRHAILVIFIISALITPTGDPMTLTLMSVPLIVLYELGILAARLFRPKRAKWDVPDEEDDKGGPSPAPTEPSPPPSEAPSAPAEPQPGEGAAYTEESGYQPEGGITEEAAPPEEPAPPPEPEPPKEEPPLEAPPPEEELPPDAVMH
ncbi:MAG: twin-arginine translocase subunit TatC [Planctomycetes bacterium]|nr:twin-arginine translocase subunit TatC [Planctomycetota bacterium]